MSDTLAAEPSVIARNFPIVRVVEKNTRTIPFQKQDISLLEEPDADDDVLGDAFQGVIEQAATEYLAKQLEEMVEKDNDIDPPTPDPEVNELLESIIDEDGEYIPEEDDFDPADAFISENLKKTVEATTMMKDTEVKTSLGAELERRPLKVAVQAGDTGTLKYLKSVEGRVLTVLEAALPDKEHRNAVKTLIKKEFRREMSRVNRTSESEEEE